MKAPAERVYSVFSRYILISTLVYFTDFFVFVLLTAQASLEALVSNILGKTVAFFVAFIGHRYFTFSNAVTGNIFHQLFKAFVACLSNIFISSSLLGLLLFSHDNLYLIKVISDAFAFFVSFLVSKYYVFR